MSKREPPAKSFDADIEALQRRLQTLMREAAQVIEQIDKAVRTAGGTSADTHQRLQHRTAALAAQTKSMARDRTGFSGREHRALQADLQHHARDLASHSGGLKDNGSPSPAKRKRPK
jgi:hypothetical protein